jgi:effector-binding domain-containing protein
MKKHFLSITLLFSLLIMLLYPLTLFAQEKEECTASGPLIEVKQVNAQKAIVVRFDVPTSEIGPAMGKAYEKLFGFLGTNSMAPAGPPFAVHYSINPTGNTVFEAGVPVSSSISGNEEIIYKEFPAMKVVSILYRGPYESLETAYGKLNSYIIANGLEAEKISWEIYLTDPSQVTDPKENQTLIYFPLK